jgi:hypothetical protein
LRYRASSFRSGLAAGYVGDAEGRVVKDAKLYLDKMMEAIGLMAASWSTNWFGATALSYR